MYYAEPRSPERRRAAADRIGRRYRPHRDRAAARAPGAAAQRGAQSRHPARHSRLDVPDDGRRASFSTITPGTHRACTSAVGIPRQARHRGAAATNWRDARAGVRARVSASDEPETVEYMMGAGDAERFYEACIVRCDGDKILSIVRDITDRRRAELETDAQRRELAHLSRVAMLGGADGRARARIEPAAHGRSQQRAGGPAPAGPRAPRRRRAARGASTTSSGTTSAPARSSTVCAHC